MNDRPTREPVYAQIGPDLKLGLRDFVDEGLRELEQYLAKVARLQELHGS